MTISPISDVRPVHHIRAVLTACALIAWCVLTAPGAVSAVQRIDAGTSAVGPASLIALTEML